VYGHHARRDGISAAPEEHRDDATIVASTRLDNREALIAQLYPGPSPPDNFPDSDLILAAYRKWGTSVPQHLLGDFSFSITDFANQVIFCARDHLGIAPFYYHLSKDDFIYGSSIQDIVRGHPQFRKICPDAVAIYLRDGELYHDRLTFAEGVKKLPAGHALLVTENDTKEWAYWRPEDSPEIEEASHEAYIERLKALLQEAVKCRMPENEVVGVHLSGGLDSSPVAALAAKECARANCSLVAYSWLAAPESDEQATDPEWSDGTVVADQYDLPLHYEDFGPDDLLEILETHNIAWGDTTDCWYEFGVRSKASDEGITTMFTGWGGDQFISHFGSGYYLEKFLQGQVVGVLRELWRICAPTDRPLHSFARLCYRLLLKPGFQSIFGQSRQVFEYLGTSTGTLAAIARELPREYVVRGHSSVRSQLLATNDRLHLNSRIESWANSGRQAGIEYRYPLLDKRVVEFALGIPPDLYRSGELGRYIFRQAVKDILPEQVWRRKNKGEPARLQRAMDVWVEALSRWHRKHGKEPIESPFIDGARLKALLEDIAGREAVLDRGTYLAVATAVKSILILNLSLESSGR
jgi:asparagine synthase (glutamine-hydrolysing)